ncbi:MAG: type II toxin-antitoxin system RelE/ParE family toxin [Rubrivivax sp.]|nr:type II toxin-antitoxin system RelE/ParE family toxin [Rubrivivax sp.]
MLEVRQTQVCAEWFSDLRAWTAKTRIDIRIRRLPPAACRLSLVACRLSLGNAGDVRPVGSGVSKLRIDHGPGYRVYFILNTDVYIVLLAGGDKSTQEKDIRNAKALAGEL